MVAALITDWLQTKVPPRMISKRYVTVVCGAHSALRMLRAEQLKTLCSLRLVGASCCVSGTVIPRWKMQTGDTLTRGTSYPATSNQ